MYPVVTGTAHTWCTADAFSDSLVPVLVPTVG